MNAFYLNKNLFVILIIALLLAQHIKSAHFLRADRRLTKRSTTLMKYLTIRIGTQLFSESYV